MTTNDTYHHIRGNILDNEVVLSQYLQIQILKSLRRLSYSKSQEVLTPLNAQQLLDSLGDTKVKFR